MYDGEKNGRKKKRIKDYRAKQSDRTAFELQVGDTFGIFVYKSVRRSQIRHVFFFFVKKKSFTNAVELFVLCHIRRIR